MVDEADLIPLSALQHFLYCPRQCGLIHIEQVWLENQFTAEGRQLHERTDQVGAESRRGVRTVTAMPVRSFRLGVAGICDVVEIVDGAGGPRPRPVEFKRGKPKAHRADEVQLCAQGMALAEMFDTDVVSGSLFYGETRRRKDVAFDGELVTLTQQVAEGARALLAAQQVPHQDYDKGRCPACSLLALCRPRLKTRGVGAWFAERVAAALEADVPAAPGEGEAG